MTYSARTSRRDRDSSAIVRLHVRPRRLGGGRGQRFDRLALLGREVGGYRDLDCDEQVARSVVTRDPAAPDPERLARARAGRDLEGDGTTVEGGNGDLRPEHGLGIRDRNREGQVAPTAPEQRMVGDARDDVEVAVGATIATRRASTLEPYALAVGDAGGDPHLHLAGTVLDAGAVASRARLVDDDPSTRARRAGLAEREVALVLVEHASAVTRRAPAGGRAGLCPRPVTGRAGHVAGEVDGRGDAVRRVLEGQVQLGFEIAATLRSRPAICARAAAGGPGEHAREHVPDVAGVEAEPTGSGRTAEHATHRAHRPDLVVLLALRRIADHVVRGRYLLEPLLRSAVVGVGVGVVLARELPVGLGDLLLRRGIGDPEDLVVVLPVPLTLRDHGRSPIPLL